LNQVFFILQDWADYTHYYLASINSRLLDQVLRHSI